MNPAIRVQIPVGPFFFPLLPPKYSLNTITGSRPGGYKQNGNKNGNKNGIENGIKNGIGKVVGQDTLAVNFIVTSKFCSNFHCYLPPAPRNDIENNVENNVKEEDKEAK